MELKIVYFVERYRGFRTYVYDELNSLKTFTPNLCKAIKLKEERL